MEKCPSYRVVRLTIVRLIEVFLRETHLRSAGPCGSVCLREVSVLWDVHQEVLPVSKFTDLVLYFMANHSLDSFFGSLLFTILRFLMSKWMNLYQNQQNFLDYSMIRWAIGPSITLKFVKPRVVDLPWNFVRWIIWLYLSGAPPFKRMLFNYWSSRLIISAWLFPPIFLVM